MEEKDITANMARETIRRQSNEEEVAAVFRLHIKRFWSQERIVLFCIELLGVNLQDYTAWRRAIEYSVHTDTPLALGLHSGNPDTCIHPECVAARNSVDE